MKSWWCAMSSWFGRTGVRYDASNKLKILADFDFSAENTSEAPASGSWEKFARKDELGKLRGWKTCSATYEERREKRRRKRWYRTRSLYQYISRSWVMFSSRQIWFFFFCRKWFFSHMRTAQWLSLLLWLKLKSAKIFLRSRWDKFAKYVRPLPKTGTNHLKSLIMNW